jgi:4,5:9,10-diseco-3-hydroxy-5,9,17-trioxoandrosta-1(10),2-diene-4-oate hydrolase
MSFTTQAVRPLNDTSYDAFQPRQPRVPCELLDESQGFLGMGRSHTFPFAQWRAFDDYRTVFFDEGYGHPLVFVHGLGGNATHFEFVAKELVRRNRVIGIDLVGCGWSRKPDLPYTIALQTEHLLSFIDSLGLGEVTLVGHSLGGAVCLGAALARPGQIKNLALISAAGLAPIPTWMRKVAPIALRRQLLYRVLFHGADFIVDNVFANGDENAGVRWFRQSALRDAPGNPNLKDFARVGESLARDAARRHFADRLSELAMPVLSLWGDCDKLTTIPQVMENLARIPRVRTVVMRRCGHMPMIEHPEQTLFQLERLLDCPPR